MSFFEYSMRIAYQHKMLFTVTKETGESPEVLILFAPQSNRNPNL